MRDVRGEKPEATTLRQKNLSRSALEPQVSHEKDENFTPLSRVRDK